MMAFQDLQKDITVFMKQRAKIYFLDWTGKETDKLFKKENFNFFLNDSKYLGIHIHRKHWEKYPIVPNSFWDWALSKYGDEIDCN